MSMSFRAIIFASLVLGASFGTACSRARSSPSPVPATAEGVVEALASVQGAFVDAGGSDIAIYFELATAHDSALFDEAVRQAETHIPALVECFADTRPARLQYGGRPVSRGAVCYWAAQRTRWFQRAVREHGARGAVNVPLLRTDAEEQRRARDYWRAYVTARQDSSSGAAT